MRERGRCCGSERQVGKRWQVQESPEELVVEYVERGHHREHVEEREVWEGEACECRHLRRGELANLLPPTISSTWNMTWSNAPTDATEAKGTSSRNGKTSSAAWLSHTPKV